MVTAIVHPCNAEAIRSAIEARDQGLITPVLVGPEHKIRAAAEQANVSIAGLRLETTEHSHAAAVRAVELGAAHEVEALMKGSLHTDELLAAVVTAQSGLRTGRRVSHVYALDVPAYPKTLIVNDAAINIAPTLEQKRDICQNAIDLLHVLGVVEPLVAVLAAVETVNPAMQATLDAAALTVMAVRGQITGAKVDGPLAFDNAISFDAARIKEIVSPVAGQADILVVPDLEAGNMLAKQLIYLAGADAAGLVLGARAPIILTSRSEFVEGSAGIRCARQARGHAPPGGGGRAVNGSVLLTLNPGSSTINRKRRAGSARGARPVRLPHRPRDGGAGQHARRARRDRLHCGNRGAPAADPRIRLPAPRMARRYDRRGGE